MYIYICVYMCVCVCLCVCACACVLINTWFFTPSQVKAPNATRSFSWICEGRGRYLYISIYILIRIDVYTIYVCVGRYFLVHPLTPSSRINPSRSSKSLTSLDLSHGFVRDEGALVLADALLANSTLLRLGLGYSGITTRGATAVCGALEVKKHIMYIYICMYVYMYIYICICICMYIDLDLYIQTHTYTCMCVCIYIFSQTAHYYVWALATRALPRGAPVLFAAR